MPDFGVIINRVIDYPELCGRTMSERKNVTIAEMAKRLGVSGATVAKALNGKGRISPGMVEKIRGLARELRYTPNIAARALRTNLKDVAGVLITSDIVNPWYSQLVSQLELELSGRGLTMLLALGKGDPEKAGYALENFFGGRVCGILAGPVQYCGDSGFLREAVDRQCPLVVFSNLEELPVNSVAIDQEAGAGMAVDYLVKRGHRRIMYLGGLHQNRRQAAGTRFSGYKLAMQAHGLKPEFRIEPVCNSRHDGFMLMNGLLRSGGELPDALFCHNDDVALGAMLALQQAGLRIPDDISLIGFDDIAESSFSVPGLTTIGGVMHELAAELVDMLQHAVADPASVSRKLIVPKLIVRSTVR